MDIKSGTAAFIIPFLGLNETSWHYLDLTLENLFEQTDRNFRIILIDDCSTYEGTREHLAKLKEKYQETLEILFNKKNEGPGASRNYGIKWAYERDYPFILYNDADDLSHPRRLEIVREIFSENPEASVIYSTFKVIDENGALVSKDKLTPALVEILESHEDDQVEGENAWIQIGIKKGYANLTSTTAVRTELAIRYPFPSLRVSEDSHTWMRYGAGGEKFVYVPEIPSLYRVPQNSAGSASRSREGGNHSFNAKKCETEAGSFLEAMEIAIGRSKIKADERDDLMIQYYIRLSESMFNESLFDLAAEQIKKAAAISKVKTAEYIRAKGFQECDWANLDAV